MCFWIVLETYPKGLRPSLGTQEQLQPGLGQYPDTPLTFLTQNAKCINPNANLDLSYSSVIEYFVFLVQTMPLSWHSLIYRGEEGYSKTDRVYILNIFRKWAWCINWYSGSLLAEWCGGRLTWQLLWLYLFWINTWSLHSVPFVSINLTPLIHSFSCSGQMERVDCLPLFA